MPTPPTQPDAPLAEPVLRRSRGFSLVWLVPVVAAAIGLWLAVTTITSQGPLVSLTFATAEGLEAGKTRVKYRDVDVGLVEAVRVAPDLSGVVVEARMEQSFAAHVTDNTRFWVVRPRIGASGVTGLGTILSGAYLEVDPAPGDAARAFVGLEEPPLIRSDIAGSEFRLIAESLGSVTRGAPVYYRGLEVGQVLGHRLTEDARRFEIPIFVRSPHDRLVTAESEFWDVSGISLRAGADGFTVQVAGLAALVAGGVEFSSPTGLAGVPAGAGTTFALYPDQGSVGEAQIQERIPYVIEFDGSVRGLRPGAPVEFRGIRVGSVERIVLVNEPQEGKAPIRVFVNLEPQRLAEDWEPPSAEAQYARTARSVARGLRAQIKTASLLTGELYIDLDIYPGAPPAELGEVAGLPLIPSVPTDLEALTATVSGVLDRVAALPLEEITGSLARAAATVETLVGSPEAAAGFGDLLAAMSQMRTLVGTVDAATTPFMRSIDGMLGSLQATVTEAQQTLRSIDTVLGEQSTLRYQLERVLQELATAARSIRGFAEALERDPGSIVRGRREF